MPSFESIGKTKLCFRRKVYSLTVSLLPASLLCKLAVYAGGIMRGLRHAVVIPPLHSFIRIQNPHSVVLNLFENFVEDGENVAAVLCNFRIVDFHSTLDDFRRSERAFFLDIVSDRRTAVFAQNFLTFYRQNIIVQKLAVFPVRGIFNKRDRT